MILLIQADNPADQGKGCLLKPLPVSGAESLHPELTYPPARTAVLYT